MKKRRLSRRKRDSQFILMASRGSELWVVQTFKDKQRAELYLRLLQDYEKGLKVKWEEVDKTELQPYAWLEKNVRKFVNPYDVEASYDATTGELRSAFDIQLRLENYGYVVQLQNIPVDSQDSKEAFFKRLRARMKRFRETRTSYPHEMFDDIPF